jgi:DEAD/DEAH box helicase domain-containing protein
VTKGRDAVIGEMDKPSAKLLLFNEAIYLHSGDQYVVKKLDLENQRCYVEETTANYYTDSIVKTDIQMLAEDRREKVAALEIALGDVLVRTQATKYKKLKFQTHENVGYGEIDLPAEEMHTRAAVLLLTGGTAAGGSFESLSEAERPLVLQRLGALVRNVAPVFLLCDPRDLGVAERLRDPTFGCPALYVYDSYPGGTGLAEGFLQNATAILAGALELVAGCACAQGCPSCIGPAESETAAEQADPKGPVVGFLRAWIGEGK